MQAKSVWCRLAGACACVAAHDVTVLQGHVALDHEHLGGLLKLRACRQKVYGVGWLVRVRVSLPMTSLPCRQPCSLELSTWGAC